MTLNAGLHNKQNAPNPFITMHIWTGSEWESVKHTLPNTRGNIPITSVQCSIKNLVTMHKPEEENWSESEMNELNNSLDNLETSFRGLKSCLQEIKTLLQNKPELD